MKFNLSIPVWGDKYIDIFCNYCLPSQMSEGNIPYLVSENDSVSVLIYTKKQDKGKFYHYPVFNRLSEIANIKFVFIDDWLEEEVNKYFLMSRCQNDSIIRSKEKSSESYVLFQVSDIFFAEGFYSYLRDLILSGKSGFASFIIPTDGEKISEQLKRYYDSDTASYSVPAKDLSVFTAENIHPDIALNIVSSKTFNSDCPSTIFWELGRDKYLLRAFHIHPLMLKVTKDTPMIPSDDTLDGGNFRYTEMECFHDEIYVLKDSSTMLCALDFESRVSYKPKRRFNYIKVASWASIYSYQLHRKLVQEKIFINADDISENHPEVIASDMIIKKILCLIDTGIVFDDWNRFQLSLMQIFFTGTGDREVLDNFVEKLDQLLLIEEDLPGEEYSAIKENTTRFKRNLKNISSGIFVSRKEGFDAVMNLILDAAEIFNSYGKGAGFELCKPLKYMDDIINRLDKISKEHISVSLYGMGLYGHFLIHLINHFTELRMDVLVDDYNNDVETIEGLKLCSYSEFDRLTEKSSCIIFCTETEELIKSMLHKTADYNGEVVSDLFLFEN